MKPTYAIWLLGENLIKTDSDYLHAYKLRDERSRILANHGGIWLLELEKFSAQCIETEQQRWLLFFKDGGRLDDNRLPDWMNTPEMRQAMSTLRKFSEKERDYHAYQARQNFIREQNTIRWEYEQMLAEKEQVLAEKEQVIAERDQALAERERERVGREQERAEKERLLALLKQAGVDYLP